MTLQECYRNLGGDDAEVLRRLMSPKLVQKFLGKFLDDDSYANLCSALQAGDRPTAFRAAHTLKGVCQNLGLGRLSQSTSQITEALRGEGENIPPEVAAMLAQVTEDYDATTSVIRGYLSALS